LRPPALAPQLKRDPLGRDSTTVISSTGDAMPDKDILWKQYAQNVDLYKFYLDLAVKINVFYYAVTGAILTYYFQHSSDRLSRFALLLPIVFSLAISGIFGYGSLLLGVVRTELFRIRDQLELDTAPDVMVLIVFLRVFGAILVLVGVALIVLFFREGGFAVAA